MADEEFSRLNDSGISDIGKDNTNMDIQSVKKSTDRLRRCIADLERMGDQNPIFKSRTEPALSNIRDRVNSLPRSISQQINYTDPLNSREESNAITNSVAERLGLPVRRGNLGARSHLVRSPAYNDLNRGIPKNPDIYSSRGGRSEHSSNSNKSDKE